MMLLEGAAEKNGRVDTRSCDELLKSLPMNTARRCRSLSAIKENIHEVHQF